MKTAFISGASRGIGKAIALKLASQGYQITVAAKTATPHPKLEGTIYTAAEEIEAAGGKALPVIVDIREEEQVQEAIRKTVSEFGGIDVLVNNASAINLSQTQGLPMKRYDLMQDINVRGTFMVSKHCIPELKKSDNPHILTLSPPLNLNPKWFGRHTAYTMAKYGMSMTVIGLAEELRAVGVAVNALWPRTTIATAAIRNLIGGEEMMRRSRKPEIMADAAAEIISRPALSCSGNFFIDDEVLAEAGISDLDSYAVEPGMDLMDDLFLGEPQF